MQYLYPFLVVLGFTFAGELLSFIIPLPVPAAIYGLLLLFAALQFGIVKLEKVEKLGSFLTGILPVLFISPAVNLIECWGAIKPNLVPLLVIMFAATVATFAAAGKISDIIISGKEKKKHD